MNLYKDIRTKDLLAMAFLKTKYWELFQDIESNRDVYTQTQRGDARYWQLYDRNDEEKYRKDHSGSLFGRLAYSTSDEKSLQSLLNEIFPDWQGEGNTSKDELHATNRIGHRELLDLYFSYGVPHQAFKERMEHVTPIIEHVAKDKYSEDSLTKQFKDFNHYALSQEEGGDVARLLARNLLRLQQEQAVPVLVWRCWLRTLLKYESGTNEAANSVLASMLSGANDSIQRTTASVPSMATVIDQRVDGAAILFENVTEYLNDTYLGLLLLLFVLPARGNSFFLDYINRHGINDLYLPILKYVDDYFIAQRHDVFREYSNSRHWRFVLFQWSLSTSQYSSINSGIPDASSRQRAVNDYVFGLLDHHPKLIYKFIDGQFLTDGDQSTGTRNWHVAHEMKQYNSNEDREHISTMVREALSSEELTISQREELVEFEKRFNEYIASSSI